MPYDYREVLDLYDTLKDAGVVTESLPQWSARKNQETGTDAYSAGLDDNWIKRGSVAVDRALESTGLPGLTEQFGRGVGGLVGAEEAGAAIGKSLPRTAASMAGFLVPGAGAVLGPALMAASAGTEAYTATGSPASGLISAGIAGAMPGVSKVAEQAVLRGLGTKAIQGPVLTGVDKLQQLAAGVAPKMISERVPETLAQGLAAYGGGQVAGSLLGAAGGQLESAFSGQPYEFSPTTELLNMTLGQLPFAGLAATRSGRVMFGGEAARQHRAALESSVKLTEEAISQHKLNEAKTAETDIERNPEVVSPEIMAQRAERGDRLLELREKQRAAKLDGTSIAEEERQKWADEENTLLSDQGALPGRILGVDVTKIPRKPAEPTDPVVKLDTAEKKLASARDNVDLQDAVTDINEVREQYGLKPMDDAAIAKRRQYFEMGSDRDAIQSHIDEVRRIATAREQGKAVAVERAVRQLPRGMSLLEGLPGERLTAERKAIETERALRQAELAHEDPTIRAAATARLAEMDSADAALDNVRKIANAPVTRDNAPVKDLQNENAARITESSPETVPGNQSKFLDYVRGGVVDVMKNHGMTRQEVLDFLTSSPDVAAWKGRLEVSMEGGLAMKEYSERYLKNLGVSPEEAARLSGLADGLSQQPDVKEGLLATVPKSAEFTKAEAEMNKFLASEPERTARLLNEKKYATVDDLYNDFVRTGKVDEAALDQLDPKVADYVYARAREHMQLADVVKAAEATKHVAKPVGSPDEAIRALQKIDETARRRIQAAADLSAMDGVAPKNYAQNLIASTAVPEMLKDAGEPVGKGLQMIRDLLKTPAWLARLGPQWAEFVAKGHQLGANTRKMAMEAFKAFGMDAKGNFEKRFVKAAGDKQVKAALSKWIGINQVKGAETGVKVVSIDDPEVARALQGLPEEKKAMVSDLMARFEVSAKTMQQQELAKMEQIYGVEGAGQLGTITKGKYERNLSIANDMWTLTKTDWQDPQQQANGQNLMGRLQLELQNYPGAFNELQRFMGEKKAEYDQKREFFEQNPAWATSKKYGKYEFSYRKGNRIVFDTAESHKQAKEIAAGNEIVSPIKRNEDHEDAPVKYEREIAPEMADARWFDNHVTWLDKNAAYWSKALYRAQSKAMLADPELQQRPDVLRLAAQHSDNMMSTDPRIAMALNRIASVWFLGFNAASSLANATQLVIRGAAQMSTMTGNPIESYKRIWDAYNAMVNPAGLNEAHREIKRRLTEDGIISGIAEQLDPQAETGADLKRILNGNSPLKTPFSNMSRLYQDVGMYMFRQVEKFNNLGAVIAAYDYYRTQKPDGRQIPHEEAYQKALVFNRSVNDVGGKANRPIKLFSGSDEFSKSAAMLASSLQTYNIGAVGQLVSHFKKGFFDQPGMMPGDKWKNKLALGQLLAVQLGAAGVVGLPGASALMAIVDKAFPSLEVEKNVRGWLTDLLSDDEEDGHIIADMAMTGIPSMFGWDFQSRLSMGTPTSLISEINGFQLDLQALAPLNLASKFIKGGRDMLQGDMSQIGNIMPPAVKKFADAGSAIGDGKIVDYNGKPVLNQPTPGEKLGLALGFQPTRVSNFNKANRMKNRSDAVHRDEEKQFSQDLAEDILKGRYDVVRQKLKGRIDEDETYDWYNGGRKAADAAIERIFPRDLRRELPPRDAKIASMFAVEPSAPSEVQRRKARADMLYRMSIPFKPRDEQKYILMDQLKPQFPNATTRELMHMAEKQLGKLKPRPELLETSA